VTAKPGIRRHGRQHELRRIRQTARVPVEPASPADLMQLAMDVGPAPMHVGAVLLLGAGSACRFSTPGSCWVSGSVRIPGCGGGTGRLQGAAGRSGPTTRPLTCTATLCSCRARHRVTGGPADVITADLTRPRSHELGGIAPAYAEAMPDSDSRPARVEDVHELALAMPHVTIEHGSSGNPVYQVGGKSFIFFRNPRPDAVDPRTGERYQDVVIFWVASEGDKQALVQDKASPFFTTAHFDGHLSVLLRASHIGDLTRDELAEVVQDAWLSRASARRAAAWLNAHPPT